MSSEAGKLSFAKAAASAMKKETGKDHNTTSAESLHKTSASAVVSAVMACVTPTTGAAANQDASAAIENGPSVATSASQLHLTSKGSSESLEGLVSAPSSSFDRAVVDGLEVLKVEPSTPGLVLQDMGTASVAKASSSMDPTPPSSEEVSQKADSNSELGTKPPSLDGKSITSGTTFNALDEKESLRPDDSASVKAAADEDDSFSIRGSLLINSRLGSDLAARAQRIQLGDMPLRVLPSLGQQAPVSCVVTPAGGSLEQQPMTEASVQLATGTSASSGLGLNGQNPDDKLLEAMQTPKDRLFLLRLENDVVNFVQDSKEPFMDLPPSNSFCRMLTHKLADYYHMTHSFEAVAGSVRIYRTPFCRVPPPLASFVSTNTPSTDTPPPIVQPRKIMKRGKDSNPPKSAGPSKPTSETGSDPKDKAPQVKEKLSREAREEAYNKARERIFAGSVPTEASENGDGTGVSRASSVSAKDRANQNKKGKPGKQRRDESDNFDSRIQYMPYYNHPQQQSWIAPPFLPVGNAQFPTTTPIQQAVPAQLQPPQQQPPLLYAEAAQPLVAYGTSVAGYLGAPQRNSVLPSVGDPPLQYRPSQSIPTRAPMQSSPSVYATPGQVNMQHPTFSHGTGYPPKQARSGPQPSVGIPYAFGQLPVNTSPHDLKSQHPIPGSYSGHSYHYPFNPATQSFVPGGNGPVPIPLPMPESAGLPPYAAGGHPHLSGQPPFQGPGPYSGSGRYMQPPIFPTSQYAGSARSGFEARHGPDNVPHDYPPAHPRLAQPPMAPGYEQQGMSPCSGGAMAHSPVVVQGGYSPAQHYANAHGPVQVHGNLRGPSHQHVHNPGKSHGHGVNTNPANRPKRATNANAGSKGTGPSSSQAYGNLPNYGNPATLPAKPTATS